MSDSEKRPWYEDLDDIERCWRYFFLEGDQIVCSPLLTHREAIRLSNHADKASRPMAVEESSLKKYRELEPGAPVLARHFTSHSELGTIGMFWELLARARDRRIASDKEKENEQA